ncbi:hypothetical protein UFOVP516_42 [uncultured Caudovirales phage]|uniref:Uncharacterized protein n=1 Tax=uncultured Caudovirales phage TaxID=2100421 RepID=A0A6J5MRW7_9CAUD|nr:hypothetical protein UFOVP516_42 [uncultured Caudovirales phage]
MSLSDLKYTKMKLADKIELFKKNNPDRLEHTFKNGLIFKGLGKQKVYWFIDSIYKDAVNEWVSSKTQENVKFLEKILK